MNILFITTGNIFASTSSTIRNLALLSGLKSEHKIDIVTLHYNVVKNAETEDALSGMSIYEIENSSLQKAFSAGNGQRGTLKQRIKYALIGMYRKFQIYDLYKRAITMSKLKRLPISDKRYDLVVSSSDPRSSHYLARKIITLFDLDCPWVQYWGDPMFGDVASNTILSWRTKQIEKRYITQADVCFYTNPLTVQEVVARYKVCADKILFVPTSALYALPSDDAERFTVGYFGDYISKWRDIRPLYQAITKLGIQSIIVGQGDIKLNETEHCRIVERKPASEVQTLMNSTRILLCICNVGDHCTQIPGKVYHYALTDKQILVIGASPQIKEYLSRYDRYSFCENDALSIGHAIERLVSDSRKCTPCEAFTPQSVAESFIQQTESVIKKEHHN